jgi:4'-phosphopantetheinyl transferase
MGLYLKKIANDSAIGVWEINEPLEDLWRSVNLSEMELKYYSLLRSDTRRQHWLSYRLILPHLISREEISGIEYDEFGKPFLSLKQEIAMRHISVSHSGKFSTLIASNTHNVGIDIERLSPKIFKVAHKFLNSRELRIVFSNNAMEGLITLWAAKEALYKLHGRRDLEFRENFQILPFEFKGQGTLQGEIIGKQKSTIYTLSYMTVEDYVIVYAID